MKYRIVAFILFFAIVATGIILVKFVLLASFKLSAFDILLIFYGLSATAFMMSRYPLALLYMGKEANRIEHLPIDYEPIVSIIIPCKNEEEYIHETIANAFASDYPKDKLQVLIVNDGSTDKTINVLRRVQQTFPALQIIDFPANKGKRDAIYEAYKFCVGDIIMVVDSDSFIEKRAVREIVYQFGQDPKLGGTCGRVTVKNPVNLLAKMEMVMYYVGFDIMRGAEALFNTVTCLPGPLSAYRRSALLPIMEEFVNQTFLGRKAVVGDDRALTQMLIKRGYHTSFTPRASTKTIAPTNFQKYIKQQLRWRRGFLRETLVGVPFMWKRHPVVSVFFYITMFLTYAAPFVVALNLFYFPILHHTFPIFYALGLAVILSVSMMFYTLIGRGKHGVAIYLWMALYLVQVFWLTPMALFVSAKVGWGNR
jgi:hyaluronan synthase